MKGTVLITQKTNKIFQYNYAVEGPHIGRFYGTFLSQKFVIEVIEKVV